MSNYSAHLEWCVIPSCCDQKSAILIYANNTHPCQYTAYQQVVCHGVEISPKKISIQLEGLSN